MTNIRWLPCVVLMALSIEIVAPILVMSFQLSTIQSTKTTTTTQLDMGSYSSALSSSISRQPLFTQVISDVDDTLKSSGGVNVAGVALGGIDVQYPRGELYPGVAEFYLGLSMHGLPEEDSMYPPKIAVLTARAEEFKAALEIKDQSKLAVALRTVGEQAGIKGWGIGPVLYGSVAGTVVMNLCKKCIFRMFSQHFNNCNFYFSLSLHIIEWIIQDRKGLRKFTNFERLIQQGEFIC